ncbi:hypothetical protein BDN70DRAFT_924270 [Pholiota conissans]|uniref:Uncharacterized protein n=1 Tax=Pholiota conissans TaxID=109636 RepID=A0A9P5YUL3_9AGAR|nr:hypothetical protein BDN70DRAFT_924270 [Pholiota conissans]
MSWPSPRRLRGFMLFAVLLYIWSYWIGYILMESPLYSMAFPPSPPSLKDVVDAALDEEISKFLRSVDYSARKPSRESLRKKTLQSALLCAVRRGTWRFKVTSNQTVWPSFATYELCPGAYSNSTSTSETASIDVCEHLPGKRVLFVGPDATYYLHSLWLASLEKHEHRSHTCLGPAFCTFHNICRQPIFEGDASVLYEGLVEKAPSKNVLMATNSSLLQYALSSTLHPSKIEKDDVPAEIITDQNVDMVFDNLSWLRRARSADILVINRGPLPAPSEPTAPFNDTDSDEWRFAEKLCTQRNYFNAGRCNESLSSRLFNAALHATINRFLPAILQSLQAITNDPDISKASLIWHSSWFMQPSCAIANLSLNLNSSMPLIPEIWSADNPCLVDPQTFYYNSQAHFNFAYIPLTMSSYAKPSSARFLEPETHQDLSSDSKDCLRHPWPTFGVESLEAIFFGALGKVLRNVV